MFDGFTDATFEFFLAIGFNNNSDFFHANADWYQREVRGRLCALAEALLPAALNLDPLIDPRPNRAVSRINRDIRFSRDKSPYRDYMWLSFRRPGADSRMALGTYFDIGVEGSNYGFGVYDENTPLMEALRARLLTDGARFEALSKAARGRFTLNGTSARKYRPPDGLSEELKAWYPLKGFYMERQIKDFALLKSPALVEEISSGWESISELYHFILGGL